MTQSRERAEERLRGAATGNGRCAAFPQNDDGSCTVGLTKREYYAGEALKGILSQGKLESWQMNVKNAVNYADELLLELEKGKRSAVP